jgi:hypothetical protein
MKRMKLTEMETKVMRFLRDDGWYNWGSEYGFSDVETGELGEMTNIDMKQLRGVLASLVKKDLIHLEDMSDWSYANYVIVYPTFNSYVYFDEVDEWVAESFSYFHSDAKKWLEDNGYTGESYYDDVTKTWHMKKK